MYPIAHFKTITHHRHLVMLYCFRAGIGWQGLGHDLSKYAPVEFISGMRLSRSQPKRCGTQSQGISYAHSPQRRNKHHIEYWIGLFQAHWDDGGDGNAIEVCGRIGVRSNRRQQGVWQNKLQRRLRIGLLYALAPSLLGPSQNRSALYRNPHDAKREWRRRHVFRAKTDDSKEQKVNTPAKPNVCEGVFLWFTLKAAFVSRKIRRQKEVRFPIWNSGQRLSHR